MEKTYIFDVLSIRKYIVVDFRVKAYTSAQARIRLYDYLITNGLVNDNLFYKLKLKEIVKND